MSKKSCEVHCADQISIKRFEDNLRQLIYCAFIAGRHNLYFEGEVLPDKIWIELKLNSEEDLVMAPLGVQRWLDLESIKTIE